MDITILYFTGEIRTGLIKKILERENTNRGSIWRGVSVEEVVIGGNSVSSVLLFSKENMH